ncbi:MAG TPA: hypothetical protein VG847_06935 [Chitinophagaceae bacterium]|nr:hypothetical protein [Chitinophagaceae bacterium]
MIYPTSEEALDFKALQLQFPDQYKLVFPDRLAKKTVIIIPSLTFDQEILQKIDGIIYYEERMLCLLMLLRMPHTHVIYVTSMPVHNIIMDYYLHLLPGITSYHAKKRLTMLSCFDPSPKSLTEKILERPRLIERIKKSIPDNHTAHLACFNVTEAERQLAVKLQVPIYGCNPDLLYLGTKSYSKKIFRECNVLTPEGFEDCRTEEHLIQSLVLLKNHLQYNLKMVARNLSYHSYLKKLSLMGGIAEVFLEAQLMAFPSVQCRITPVGEVEIISTHDQVLGGDNGQVFLGASFPADREYAAAIGSRAAQIAIKLQTLGVIGRFGIDFISVKQNGAWIHYASEINLRKGGTTHPYLMLQYLTDGNYNADTGIYTAANGQQCYYFFSDNLQSENYKGLTPHDLIEITIVNNLLYDSSNHEGVMFHMIGALSQYGKMGILCIASSPEKTIELYNKTIAVLEKEKQSGK